MRETWARYLGREYPLEEEMTTNSSILAWKIPRTEEPATLHTVHGVAKSQTQLSDITCFLLSFAILWSKSLEEPLYF